MAVKKKDELKSMLGSLSGGRSSLAAPTSQDTGGRSSLVSGASKVLSAAADKLKQQSGGANSPYTKTTPSTWRPNDTSGNDYAGMSGMSALHKAALEAAGRDYQTATTQQQRDAAHNQAEAIRALYNYSGGSDGSQYLPSAAAPTYKETAAPTYEDSYSARINSMIDDIINRKPFSYDAESDPLYQQYKASYTRQGERAMQDTLGQMSARTGGLASSYAGSAAQQTYDNYMAAVADKIPELQQLAYNMYLQDLDSKRQDVALLQGQSNSDYGRFRDSMGDYQTDRSFGYGKYRDSMGDYKDDRSYRYQLDRDNISDKRYENEWNYNVGRDQISDQRYADETAYNRTQAESSTAYDRAMQLLSAGVMPDSTVLNRAGLTGSQANQMLAAAQATVRSSGGSSGGRRSSGGGAGGSKPRLTAAQVFSALENGVVNDTTLAGYEYYFGQPWPGLDDSVTKNTPQTSTANSKDEHPIMNPTGKTEKGEWIYVVGLGQLSESQLADKLNRGEVKEYVDKKTGRVTYKMASRY